MKKIIYMDFDSTIFNTGKFYSDFIFLCKKYNIEKDIINKERNILFKKKADFNLDKLAKKLEKEYNLGKKFLTEVEDLYSEKYLYKDALLFLKEMYLKYNLVLLTYGNVGYQRKKVNKTNIVRYFKKIIITNKSKSSLNIDYANSIFIDNNPAELLGYYNKGAQKLIRIKKKDDSYFFNKTNIDVVLEFNNYNDLIECNIIGEWFKNE